MADDPATLAARLLSFIEAARSKASATFPTHPRRRPSSLQLVVEECLDQLTPDERDTLGRLIEQLFGAL